MSEREWSSSYPPQGSNGGDRLYKVKAILARIFGDGENPLAWGFTIARFKGVRVRLHLLFVVYLISELIFTLPGNQEGFVFVWPRLAAMLVLVLVHELARCLVSRRLGGEMNELMLWPLGGLSTSKVPEHWRAELWVALAGPIVNLLLVPCLALPLYFLTGSFDALAFNPLTLGLSSGELVLSTGQATLWLELIRAFYAINLVLLVFNLFVPMLPLDGARITTALLWRSMPKSKAMMRSANIGLGAATVLGLVGILFEDGNTLLVIAIVGGIICSMEKRRLQFLSYGSMVPGHQDYDGESWKTGNTGDSEPLVDEDDQEVVPQAELDRILSKISESGIESLSRKERRSLKRATESSRKS